LLDTEAHGKIVFCALYVGLARRALDLSIEYALARTHRGRPIGHKFQMIQAKLARMKTKVEALRAYLWQTCAKVDRNENIALDAAILKLLVGEEVKSITADAMEVHGAYGLSEEYDVARLYRTAISAQVVMGGVLDVQRVIVARSLLGQGH
ncbi:MAG: acyl-CoA dehydrogenase, partial [Proteobacteria bacterium]|nr:acyl-CoA dehydrogenase [Pseudomonadota bacterium]